MTHKRYDRFINNTLSKFQEANQNSIFDYDNLPVLTLEEAVEKIIPMVPDVVDYVAKAKENCNRNSTLLTWDESAAIYLYSMPVPFYSPLNIALRGENRHALKKWFAFLKLFITALKKLPPTKATIWRGVDYDATLTFVDNDVHILWNINSCTMDPSVVQPFLGESGTLFVINTILGKDISTFSAIPDEKEVILLPGTRVRRKHEALNFIYRLFVIHLEEITPQNESQSESNYLFEQIRQQYQRNSRIERFMNPSKSFPIEQSYINLAIVKAKEQHEKEKQLCNAQHSHAIMDSFEEIYGMKTAIDVKDIFETCKNQEKQVLVFGRAGIGKSTFCRYIAYQWARGSYWPQYELLALIPLRRLTANRYPPGTNYSLIDLVKNEVIQYDLTEQEEILLRKQFDAKKTLWILDGYDEVVQNVPPHLERLFEQLLKTSHHILTSRPYLNTLSYDVQMEITGFTDENIVKYLQQFFDQMKDELVDALIRNETLLNFLRSNSSIWGVAHIPVNLELICSIWSNEDLSETKELTITALYSMMTEWLCRRYLRTQNNQIRQLSQDEIHQCCRKELAFLESLAFNAMESNTIIIRPSLLKKALVEAKVSSQECPDILNIGILKSFNKQGTGNQIQMNNHHYFVHLSFQEYFAARYLINALKGSETQKAVEFIKHQKYNRRYALVFSFAAGLLSETDTKTCINIFWNNILGEPLDLVGIRHMQLVISCIEATSGKPTVPRRTELLAWIGECIEHNFSTKTKIILDQLTQSLERAQSVVCDKTILDAFNNLLQSNDTDPKAKALSFISNLKISNPPMTLISSVTARLDDVNEQIRGNACYALGKMGEKAATIEVISKLVSALGDENEYVRLNACYALGKMGEKAATNEVISKLVSALGDENFNVRANACYALGKMGEKAATYEVISKLMSALGDEDEHVRDRACEALGEMGEKAATNEVLSKLVSALGDENEGVRESACAALGKMGEKAATNEGVRRSACYALGNMGETAATNEVISKLVSALGDENEGVRLNACYALGKMGEKAATNEVISKLVSALGDENFNVRANACYALGKMGEKAATNEVISKLVSALGDEDEHVRDRACEALGEMGEKAATNEVISRLVSALGDENEGVRESACAALGKMGEKAATNEGVRRSACYALGNMGETAATNEVISKLVSALGDENVNVRWNACEALVQMGEKAATNEVISKLVSALGDEREYVRRSACYALVNMGETAAKNEVISKLVSAVGDEREYVRANACYALGKMGEKAATNEVISKLVSTLGDENKYVRMNACEALGKMGEKAATNEVISKLVSALGDENERVRRSACYALGKMGEKAATNEVISKLVSTLGDENERVRRSACYALGKMGEKAATNEVISKLVSTLGDENKYVRMNACEALGKMGEKAATNEVISKLVSALGDENEGVRWNACEALDKMGEKAATNEVINKLVSTLGDDNFDVGNSAWKALGKMGEKAATNEVISKLVSALGDENVNVRMNACEALGKMGEGAATNEVISKLVSALRDENEYVRWGACEALGEMGEKAATNVVISKLVSTLGDENKYVRMMACHALGKMGEKAATNEVISKLVSALGDENEGVRRNACEALGKMGEKAATNEVISKLVSALGDDNYDVRWSACEALGKIGEKAAMNEVISKLVSMIITEDSFDSRKAASTIGKILSSTAVITQLDPSIAASLCLCKRASDCLKNISEDELIKLFFKAQNTDWLLTISNVTLLKGAGVTSAAEKVVVYSSKEPLELSVANSELTRQLIEALADQRERWHLYFDK